MTRYVLGIHDGHNASAALVADGRIVSAVQEERLSRVKNQWGYPDRAIARVLAIAGIDLDTVDDIAVVNRYQDRYIEWDRASVRARYAAGRRPDLRDALRRIAPLRALRKRQLERGRLGMLLRRGLPANRLHVIEHHEAHAAAAYHCWGRREDALVLTADGYGDFLCGSVSIGRGGRLGRIAAIDADASVGQLYSAVTFLLGLVPLEDEHKVMGLAPYGDRLVEGRERVHRKLARLFRLRDDLGWELGRGVGSMVSPLDAVADILAHERFDWIAAGLQRFLEEFMTAWVAECVRRTGIQRVAVGGGVFMNVKLNQRIAELPEIEDLFPMPSCGDESNSIGAALLVAAGSGRSPGPLEHLYLGDDFEDEHVLDLLRPGPFRWHRSDDPEAEVAELLAHGEIVARMSGRAEFGARALGDRAILADPSRWGAVREINEMIKSRDFWMPFAPAVLSERTDDYVRKPKPLTAPYMTITFDTRAERRDALTAAIHPADATARIQEVDARTNPRFDRVLREFQRHTGEGALLNTSFNLHGSPMVYGPEDALSVFERSGLRHLQLGSFVIGKDEV